MCRRIFSASGRLYLGLNVLLVSCCFGLLTTDLAAQKLVYPGDTIVFEKADEFREDVSTCDGLNDCSAAFLEDEQAIKVKTFIFGFPKEAHARGEAVNHFEIAPSLLQSDKSITGVVSGELTIYGELVVDGALIEEEEAKIKIVVRVWEAVSGRMIAEQVILDEDCPNNILGSCYREFSKDPVSYYVPVELNRGEAYTIGVIARCKSDIDYEGKSACIFGGGLVTPRVVRWPITLSVERDYGEEILILQQELQNLKEDHESHSHIYKTGPGAAHNKEDAETSLPENPNEQ